MLLPHAPLLGQPKLLSLDLVGKVLVSRRLQKASVVLDRHRLCAASVQLDASRNEAGSTF